MKIKQLSIQIEKGIKRLLDLLISIIGLIFLSPILIIIAISIKLDSPGKVLYSHQRIGKNGRVFLLNKFRSMVCGGDDTGYMEYLHQLIESDQDGCGNGLPYRKMDDDHRVTRVGKFLRKFYLDEVPQLWNVLKGEMSLIGPRPHVQMEVDCYSFEQRRRLSVKPGMTGLWQVIGKANCTFGELIQLDLDYIDNWSLKLDFKIAFYTIILMLKGGEGFWTRKARESIEVFPTRQVLAAPNAFHYESTKQN
jgi:lipopolysaccharide/colanic/teichoic acid biosynthesis glycosyltransferase